MKFSLQSQVPTGNGHRQKGIGFIPKASNREVDLFEGLVAPDKSIYETKEKWDAAQKAYVAQCDARLYDLFADKHVARTALDEEARAEMAKREPAKVVKASDLKDPETLHAEVLDLKNKVISLTTQMAGLGAMKSNAESAKAALEEALAKTQAERNELASKLSEQGKTLAEQSKQIADVVDQIGKVKLSLKAKKSADGEGPPAS